MTTTQTHTALSQVIDLDRYPVDLLDSPRGRAMVEFCRASLAFEGACQLPGFLRPEAVRRLVAETQAKRDRAYRTDATHNVYFEDVPATAARDDTLSLLQHSSKSAIAWDLVDADSPLRLAYGSDELTGFLGRALGVAELHRYADPLGSASLMVFEEGDELGWHFDRSPFAVTVMVQPSARGGAYEYHHDLRGEDHENSEALRAAVRDDLPGRITLPNEPGTLSLFRGRHSLHRVTPVRGDQVRINAVLAYSERPGDRMNRLTQELFYGRSA
ncbi:hypothetical protein [Pseudonocardia sp. KRD291]|uniref:HalD/BesD family halogenase n=1 Tax=Pseudonocardia sp. KRD291 TaxID=2792007 RepID=UPI001C4A2031|nr:hypothetical protein [Pseudonocardia sp. KRD291]MBW0102340.1 hypothetical protein [Pseudonocardia sp. KRD291]